MEQELGCHCDMQPAPVPPAVLPQVGSHPSVPNRLGLAGEELELAAELGRSWSRL